MDIFVICTRSEGGRFLRTATTSNETLNAEITKISAEWTAEGWNNTRTQFPDRDERDAAPLLCVFRFVDGSGGWRLIEVYGVQE